MNRYKVINKMKICGNTIVTIHRPIKPIKIGEYINDGTHKVISVALGSRSLTSIDDIDLVINGDFSADEIYY